MSKSSSSTTSSGMGFVGWLQLAFIVLKLMGYITWPWVYVMLPFIISTGIGLVFIIIFGILWVINNK